MDWVCAVGGEMYREREGEITGACHSACRGINQQELQPQEKKGVPPPRATGCLSTDNVFISRVPPQDKVLSFQRNG